jgi:hypothetical protein
MERHRDYNKFISFSHYLIYRGEGTKGQAVIGLSHSPFAVIGFEVEDFRIDILLEAGLQIYKGRDSADSRSRSKAGLTRGGGDDDGKQYGKKKGEDDRGAHQGDLEAATTQFGSRIKARHETTTT